MDRMPKPGEIYNHFKDKPYQIITVATHSETSESMVVYQALYGDFKTYVRPLEMFLSEVDNEKYPDAKQIGRFELRKTEEIAQKNKNNDQELWMTEEKPEKEDVEAVFENKAIVGVDTKGNDTEEGVNPILLEFLDADSYSKKQTIISSNIEHFDDRLVNNMAVSLDCTVDEGPIEKRIQELLCCLKAMSRFEDRRLR